MSQLLAVPQPPPWMIVSEANTFFATSGVNSANTVYLYAFTVPVPVSISGMRIRVGTTASGTTDLGIYDVNGNLLVHTGAVTNVASTNMTNNFSSPFALAPGKYYLAFCPSNSTDTVLRGNAGNTVLPQTPWKQAVNNGTAGVLPATTGGTAAVGNSPVMAAIVVGGLS